MSGIYIHIPFCKQACHYCDFHFSTNLKKKEAMIQALVKEIELRKGEFDHEIIETVYFGGGTPSILQIRELQEILNAIYSHYTVAKDAEITLEANPDDLVADSRSLSGAEGNGIIGTKLKHYKEIGINRLSIGIQSFFEEDLRLINRAHSSEQAKDCLSRATAYFDNLSVDLIYGIPGLSHKRWRENIAKALSYGIPHISSYALTVEPKTALAYMIKTGKMADVDDNQAQEQFHILLEALEEKGFVNYEISNFGKPGRFSRNNTAYWRQKKYIGIGPSAHSYDGRRRSWNVNNNSTYIKALERRELPMETETLSTTDRYNEYIMTGLRTMWGVSLTKVRTEYGTNYGTYLEEHAQGHIKEKLLYLDGDRLLTTRKGKFFADGIAAHLFMLNLE
ncbi:MAG: radical SAM family heme chaperone HemW [Bacteroidota bacterium]